MYKTNYLKIYIRTAILPPLSYLYYYVLNIHVCTMVSEVPVILFTNLCSLYWVSVTTGCSSVNVYVHLKKKLFMCRRCDWWGTGEVGPITCWPPRFILKSCLSNYLSGCRYMYCCIKLSKYSSVRGRKGWWIRLLACRNALLPAAPLIIIVWRQRRLQQIREIICN
jgi:hypothetical protein